MNCIYCGSHLPERDELPNKHWRCLKCKVLWEDMGKEVWTWKRDEGEMGWEEVPQGTLLVIWEMAL